MRKRLIPEGSCDESTAEPRWLDLEQLAEAEISSEDDHFPIESALVPGKGSGWRAVHPGPQTIRLRFDRWQKVGRIELTFEEREVERTQEFVLRWSPDGRSYRDLRRQQYTFSPKGATSEVETYEVELDGVKALELEIMPEIRGGAVRASLVRWRVG